GSKEARRKARREERLERKRLRRDAVLDQKRRNRIETKLEESFVESVLLEALPDDPAAMPPAMPDAKAIDVSLVSNAVDGDRVWVQLSDALSWQFDRKYLKKVKKEKATLPVELADLLANSGVSQRDFAKTALKLFK
nr:hypothetical protein [Myxococcota bacterium]